MFEDKVIKQAFLDYLLFWLITPVFANTIPPSPLPYLCLYVIGLTTEYRPYRQTGTGRNCSLSRRLRNRVLLSTRRYSVQSESLLQIDVKAVVVNSIRTRLNYLFIS